MGIFIGHKEKMLGNGSKALMQELTENRKTSWIYKEKVIWEYRRAYLKYTKTLIVKNHYKITWCICLASHLPIIWCQNLLSFRKTIPFFRRSWSSSLSALRWTQDWASPTRYLTFLPLVVDSRMADSQGRPTRILQGFCLLICFVCLFV